VEAKKPKGDEMNNHLPLVKIENGRPMTTSMAVADYFERQHKDVLESIRNILAVVPEDFSRRNFPPREYKDSRGHIRRSYLLSKSGFAMTALGFTGKRAIEFRLAYVQRFDEMEAELIDRQIKTLENKYVRQLLLPTDQPVIRESISLSDACKHLRILGVHLTLTPGQLKGKIKRGELEGHQDSRGYWRIYIDQVTKLATGH
jgi:Rha family phage regulatory protein